MPWYSMHMQTSVLCANWSVISHVGRIIHDIIQINTLLLTCINAGSKQISSITEGHPRQITVNNMSMAYRKTTGTFQLYKKELNGVPVRLQHCQLSQNKFTTKA